MNKASKIALLFGLLMLPNLAAKASTVDYTTPGTYTVPANCGFEVLGTSNNWIRMTLTNDQGIANSCSIRYSDLWAVGGEVYPLALRELTLFTGSPGIRVTTTPGCTCSTVLDPSAASGTCYTRSMNADECEYDPNRPEIADPLEFEPGPDILFSGGVGTYASGQGDIDYLTYAQGNDGEHWNTLRAHEGAWGFTGHAIRRCRLVDGSNNNFLTLIAP